MRSRKSGSRYRKGFGPFLMSVPFLIATFVFCYMPLWGWILSFFNYKPGFSFWECEFVGLKYYLWLFRNPVIIRDVVRVLRNTLGMYFLGLAMSWLTPAFAIFLAEIRNKVFSRTVQTLTTLPNFISWVIVYALAFAMLSVDSGFINNLLVDLHIIDAEINFLASPDNIWIKMWAYGTWKGLGWGAILYIAAISSVDLELYDAVAIDGASRMQRIWHITVPAILPTYLVLLLLSIASLLNRGIDQYLVFSNAMNKEWIEVLDLYLYNQGIKGSQISFSTAVGILNSVINVTLLFTANAASKLIRGEKII